MPKLKIDRVKLNQLLKAGKSQREVAQVFDVTEGAISKAKKELNIAVVKSVALENAHKVVEQSLDTIDQLKHINTKTKEILAELTGEDHIIDNMVKAVQAFIEFEANPTKDNSKYLTTIIKKIVGEKNTAIKACDQILKQLNFQLDIFKTLHDAEAIQEFQQEVINIMGEVSPELRNKFIRRLKEKRALRGSVTIN